MKQNILRSTSWLEYHLKIGPFSSFSSLSSMNMAKIWGMPVCPIFGSNFCEIFFTQEPLFSSANLSMFSRNFHGDHPHLGDQSCALAPEGHRRHCAPGKTMKNAEIAGGCGSFLRVSFILLYIDTYIIYFNEIKGHFRDFKEFSGIFKNLYVCMHACMHACMYICMSMYCICICICICICMCICICLCI